MIWSCFVVFSSLSWLSYARQCYSPNGSPYDDPAFVPCINIQGVNSMCCATNRTSGADTCLPNGLCQNGDNLLRDLCTDHTWQSPNCLNNICADGDTANGYAIMTQCPDSTWCCGANNYTGCCNVGLGFKLAPNLVNFVASSVTASGNESTTITTATATVTATAAAASGNATNKLAIGLGVGLGVLAILGTLGGFVGGLMKGKQAAKANVADNYNEKNGYQRAPLEHNIEIDGHPVSELPNDTYKYGSPT